MRSKTKGSVIYSPIYSISGPKLVPDKKMERSLNQKSLILGGESFTRWLLWGIALVLGS